MEFKGEVDRGESFRRAGSIPFQWEIQPGVPKHIAADVDAGSPPPPLLPQKLPPPPAMQAAISPSPSLLSRSRSSCSSSGDGGGAVCFPSLSFKHRNEKRVMKISSLLSRLCRRSVSDRFVPRSSPSSSSLTEEDEFEVGSSGRSLTPSDAGSF